MAEGLIASAVLAAVLLVIWRTVRHGRVLHCRSAYSEILVCDEGPFRSMFFLSTKGHRDLESAMDRHKPERLVLAYSRMMLLGMVFASSRQRALVLGLGGGSLPRFSEHYFPETRLDIVEIDPEIDRIARRLFFWEPRNNTRIIIQDAFDFLRSSANTYDIIYVDAFLPRGDQTDSMGIPLRMKSAEFYRELRRHITPEGAIVMNMNRSSHVEDDVTGIRAVFEGVFRFSVPGTHNEVVIACVGRPDWEELRQRASHLNERGIPEVDFAGMLLHWNGEPSAHAQQ